MVPSPLRKMLELIVKLETLSLMSHIYLNTKIEDIEIIQHKLKPADLNNISFIIHKCIEKLIIQSTYILVKSTTP